MTGGSLQAQPLLGYFKWAIESLDDTRYLVELLQSRPTAETVKAIVDELENASKQRARSLWFGVSPAFSWMTSPFETTLSLRLPSNYMTVVGQGLNEVLERVDVHYGADSRPTSIQLRPLEELAYKFFLECVLDALAGSVEALGGLCVLMIRGNVNQQTTIARFLGLITDGRIGAIEPGIPTDDQVLEWAGLVNRRSFEISPGELRLFELVREYVLQATRQHKA